MAHGKETPKQKMIGMMYLVLTALLALNVSKSVLDAFKIIDEGLGKTLITIGIKNNDVYNAFNAQFGLNPDKVGSWRNQALDIQKQADTLVRKIQEIKIIVLNEARDNEAVEANNQINRDKVEAITDYDTPYRIMIGEDLERSRARNLRKEIEKYRENLLDLIPDNSRNVRAVQARNSIQGSLETEIKNEDGKIPQNREEAIWELHKFGHAPMMGFMAIMSSLQISIRNAESEAINFLYDQISAQDIKFNKVSALVVPNSEYIIRGSEYRAEIFMAAFDTTKPPTVKIAQSSMPYEAYKDSLGKTSYRLRKDLTYSTLPNEGGKAVYKVPTSSTGQKEWGGIIEVQGPDGNIILQPFKASYMVAQGSVTVSPTKMNVFYLGVPNPVDIIVAGVPAEKVTADITNGRIARAGGSGSWVVHPKRPGNSVVTVYAQIDGKNKRVDAKEFRVKIVPDPVAKVAGRRGGPISKSELMAQAGVFADMENFDFDLRFNVTEFNVVAIVQGFVKDARTKGNRFSERQKEIMSGLSKGQLLYIEDIKAVGPDGSTRNLGTINFKIQ